MSIDEIFVKIAESKNKNKGISKFTELLKKLFSRQ